MLLTRYSYLKHPPSFHIISLLNHLVKIASNNKILTLNFMKHIKIENLYSSHLLVVDFSYFYFTQVSQEGHMSSSSGGSVQNGHMRQLSVDTTHGNQRGAFPRSPSSAGRSVVVLYDSTYCQFNENTSCLVFRNLIVIKKQFF